MMAFVCLLIQANLNHSAVYQDLSLLTMAVWGTSLLIVAEPYRVPDNSDWLTNKLNLMSIVRRRIVTSSSFRVLDSDQGSVMVVWSKL